MHDDLKPIPGWPQYRASSDGRIWRYSKRSGWRTLQGSTMNGYQRVHLRDRATGRRQYCYAHRLVWQAFRGNTPKRISHLDNDRSNNAIQNLISYGREPRRPEPTREEYAKMFKAYLLGADIDALCLTWRMSTQKFLRRLNTWVQALRWRRHKSNVYCACNGLVALNHQIMLTRWVNDYRTVTIRDKTIRVCDLMVEAWIGRTLRRGEYVRHLNKNSGDDRIENLTLYRRGKYRYFRIEGKFYEIDAFGVDTDSVNM